MSDSPLRSRDRPAPTAESTAGDHPVEHDPRSVGGSPQQEALSELPAFDTFIHRDSHGPTTLNSGVDSDASSASDFDAPFPGPAVGGDEPDRRKLNASTTSASSDDVGGYLLPPDPGPAFTPIYYRRRYTASEIRARKQEVLRHLAQRRRK